MNEAGSMSCKRQEKETERSRKEKGPRDLGRGELGREASAVSRQRQAQQAGPRSAEYRGGNHTADPQIQNVGKNTSATIVVSDRATPREEGDWVFITAMEKAAELSATVVSFIFATYDAHVCRERRWRCDLHVCV